MGDIIYGGNSSLKGGPNAGTGQGVYAQYPASTPHYHTGNDNESAKRQARLFINLPDPATAAELRKRVPVRSRQMFDVLSRIDDSGRGQTAAPGVGFFDFLVTNVSAQRSEKVQIAEVLSDTFVAYFFGEKAPVWSVQGTLFNTQQDDWFEAWHLLYNDVLRGSQLARLGVPARLSYNRRTVVGYLLNSSETIMATTEMAVSLSFQFLVKRVEISSAQRYRANNLAKGNTNAAPAPFESEQAGTGKEPVVRSRINVRSEVKDLIDRTTTAVTNGVETLVDDAVAAFGSEGSKAFTRAAVTASNAPVDVLQGDLLLRSDTVLRNGYDPAETRERNILDADLGLYSGSAFTDAPVPEPEVAVGPVADTE